MEYVFHVNGKDIVIGEDKHYHIYYVDNGVKKRITRKQIQLLLNLENYKWEKALRNKRKKFIVALNEVF